MAKKQTKHKKQTGNTKNQKETKTNTTNKEEGDKPKNGHAETKATYKTPPLKNETIKKKRTYNKNK